MTGAYPVPLVETIAVDVEQGGPWIGCFKSKKGAARMSECRVRRAR
jgi:hypothetical protein